LGNERRLRIADIRRLNREMLSSLAEEASGIVRVRQMGHGRIVNVGRLGGTHADVENHRHRSRWD